MAKKSSKQTAKTCWGNRKKISQIIKDYFCLTFFLFIIFWSITVLRMRIHMFLGLLDPDPDPLVRGMDPDPDPALDPDPLEKP
jgi:hypothetical protein